MAKNPAIEPKPKKKAAASSATKRAMNEAEADLRGDNNDINGEAAIRAIKAYEREEANLESRRGEYMAACKPHRAKQRSIIEKAHNDGVPIRALKDELKIRALERKVSRIKFSPDEEDNEMLARLEASLGDFASTGLGRAAIAAERKEAAPPPPDNVTRLSA